MMELLIADDHPLFRAALHRATEDAVEDLRISETNSLDGVLEAIEGHDIDLLLLDLHMPGNHGLAGLATIRALRPGLAIIIVPSFYVGMIGGVMIFIAVAIDAVRVRYFG